MNVVQVLVVSVEKLNWNEVDSVIVVAKLEVNAVVDNDLNSVLKVLVWFPEDVLVSVVRKLEVSVVTNPEVSVVVPVVVCVVVWVVGLVVVSVV